jgi:hypothetical protein
MFIKVHYNKNILWLCIASTSLWHLMRCLFNLYIVTDFIALSKFIQFRVILIIHFIFSIRVLFNGKKPATGMR